MLDAVIFDLGNVFAFHDNEQLFAAMGEAFGRTRDELRARLDGGLWREANTGGLPGDSLRQALNERLEAQVDEATWARVWCCHFRLHPEMVALAERLVGRVKLVLLSNTHDQHVAYLRPQLPILERFDGLVLSYEVGLMKPEAGIYQRALALTGAPPARVAFFDDVPAYAEAASALGLHGRVFTTAARCEADLAALGLAAAVAQPTKV